MTDFGAALAATAVKSASGPATFALNRWGRKKYDKFIATYTNYLSEYVTSSINQCSNVSNILYKNQSAKTLEKYVNVEFEREDDLVSDESLVAALIGQRRILIRGSGGAGKTMFTKWSVLQIVQTLENHQKIPLFIELRDLPIEQPLSALEELVFRKISSNRHRTNFSQFLEGVKAGIFIFVLDAADEVRKDMRGPMLKRINQFAQTFPETSILLTSRDFQQIDGIGGFEEYRTVDLTSEQAVEILKRIDYKEKVRNALISDIQAGAFEKHSFFLNNPLLVTILLLTFDQSRELPTKRSAFYKRAFEALYERHDSSKDVDFSRDQHAGLPIDDFERVFSHFCFATYVNSVYDFSLERLNELFKLSVLETIGDGIVSSDVAKDAVESACLLVQEGHDYRFVHRSFQEYFCVLYIKNYKEKDIGQIIELAILNGHGENTLEFLYELDQRSLERDFVLPRLTKIVSRMSKYDLESSDGCVKFVANFFKYIMLLPEGLIFAGLKFPKNGDSIFLFNISSLYPELDIFRIFSSRGLTHESFRDLPKDAMLATASAKSIENGKLMRVSFSPTAKDWISQSDIPERARTFASGLESLRERLKDAYSERPATALDRFAAFSREDG